MKKITRRWSKNQFKEYPENDNDLLFALWEAYRMAKRAKCRTEDENKFEMFAMKNLELLANDIRYHRYKPGRSRAFMISRPVDREIFAAPFRDRVIHHFLFAMNSLWWDERYIYDAYSCRDKKGTLLGANRLQEFMEKCSAAGSKKAWIIKIDISGYFMSLSRRRLFGRALEGLNKQYPNRQKDPAEKWAYEICRYLWFEIIFDDPVDGVKRVGKLSDWNRLPKRKSLLFQPEGQGIVIGNLTSQSLSNTYLDQFDHFMKEKMKFKYYGRYVDDAVVVVPDEELKDALEKFKKEVPEFLKSLGLTMHPNKFYVQPIEKGCPFLGYNVHRTYKTISKRTRGNYWQAVEDYLAGKKGIESILSYLGHTKHTNDEKLNQKILKKMGIKYKYQSSKKDIWSSFKREDI